MALKVYRKTKILGPESAWITLPAALGRQLLLCSVAGLSVGLRGKEICGFKDTPKSDLD